MSINAYKDFGQFNPDSGIIPIVRLLCGPIKQGPVTFDQQFGPGIYGRWIYVSGDGGGLDLFYTCWDGSIGQSLSIAGGVWHPIFALQINSSGTTVPANQLRWGD